MSGFDKKIDTKELEKKRQKILLNKMNQIYDEEFITRCAFKNINSLQRKIYRKECLKRRNFIEIITYIYIYIYIYVQLV